MRNQKEIQSKFWVKIKTIILVCIVVLPIALVSLVTILQDNYIQNKKIISQNQIINLNEEEKSHHNIIEISNLIFYYLKYDLKKNIDQTTDNLAKSSKTFSFQTSKIIDLFLKQDFIEQKNQIGLHPVYQNWFPTRWSLFNTIDVYNKKNKAVIPIEKTSSNYFDFGNIIIKNDLKKTVFQKLRDYMEFFSLGSKDIIDKLKGYLQNAETKQTLFSSFNWWNEFITNPTIKDFFVDEHNKKRFEVINLEAIESLWNVWNKILKPFYSNLDKLKNNFSEKKDFIKQHLLVNYTNEQSIELEKILETKNWNKFFQTLQTFDGENLADIIKNKIAKSTEKDFVNFDWIQFLISFSDKESTQKIFNILISFYLQYLLELVDEKDNKLFKVTKLNDLIIDFLHFIKNGLFTNSKKFHFLIDGFQKKYNSIIDELSKKNSKWNSLKSQLPNVLFNDQGRLIIIRLLKQSVKNNLGKINEIEEYLKLTSKIFGNFEIDRLVHIMGNKSTIDQIKELFDEIRSSFKATGDAIKNKQEDLYIKQLLLFFQSISKALKYLSTDNILNKTPGQKINNNFALWSTLLLGYLKPQNPIWEEISEYFYLLTNNFNDEELLELFIMWLDILDSFLTLTVNFSDWKEKNPNVNQSDVNQKLFEFIVHNNDAGVLNGDQQQLNFLNKLFNKIIEIKTKFSKQIIALSIEGETFFNKKLHQALNKVRVENWIYTFKVLESQTSDDKILYFNLKSNFGLGEPNFHYEILWKLQKYNNIEFLGIKEITTG